MNNNAAMPCAASYVVLLPLPPLIACHPPTHPASPTRPPLSSVPHLTHQSEPERETETYTKRLHTYTHVPRFLAVREDRTPHLRHNIHTYTQQEGGR